MKSTGIVRKIDELGRIVIPKELRKLRSLEIGTPIEIFVDSDKIVLKKYEPGMKCSITDEITDENIQVGEVVLSKKGALLLMEELNKQLEEVK
ncbi:MAG: AbrB/MazE/SpoVT family DNA-binding domain-containing protein [Bacillus sp. (in: firmicutes)]